MSYVVIENMKLVVEIEDIEDVEPFEKEALDELVSEKNLNEYDIDIDETKISDLTFKETVILYKAHDTIKTLLGIDADKMLLYWLKNRDVEYCIESDIDVSKFQRDGYIILEKET
jgi:hypothetical protein